MAVRTFAPVNSSTRRSRITRRLRNLGNKALAALVIIALAVIVGAIYSATMLVQNTYTGCTVTNTDTAYTGTGKNVKIQKRVYTEGCNGQDAVQVFTADDNFIYGQFNSADIYGSIQEGQTYDFQTRGIRIHLTSAFPNITDVQK
jgi:hypothetical protein